ncbi:unnamed protein product [Parnassius apollo]|uniref:(apollo) hypothetical protein n=1 Tax=Parnassius apollo TaxID=110799 RepID=A0A8S3X3H1_PARAO|nr:unnamed protein product [Parnassius apollo]
MDPFQNPIPSTSGSVAELEKILQTWENPSEGIGAEVTIEDDILSDRDLLGILQEDIIDEYIMSPTHIIDPTEIFFEEDPLSIAIEQTGWTIGNPSRESQNLFEFRGEPGLKVNLGDHPVDYFRAIMTNTCFETLIRCTNDYGNRLKSHATGSARAVTWKNVSIQEMELFLGLLFQMGFVKLNRIVDYWKKDILFHQPIFSKKMARNRFQLILRSLNVQTVQNTTSYEKSKMDFRFFQ